MNLQLRVSLTAAAVVALAFVAASSAVYLIVRDQLRGRIDQSLERRADVAQDTAREQALTDPTVVRIPPPEFGDATGVFQLVSPTGALDLPVQPTTPLPVSSADRQVAASKRGDNFSDVTVQGTHLRVLTVPIIDGLAIQIARPLTDTDRTLSRLTNALVIITLAGILLAFFLVRAVSRTALAPVRRLTETTERVAETHDLGERIAEPRSDELGRLARSFNEMLEELDQSVRAQRALVADASHELRTPLTSLRTNIEVLARSSDMPADERERMLRDMLEQHTELTGLVTDLIDLARGDEPVGGYEDVRLDELAEHAVDRARRHASGVEFESDLEPCVVKGDPARLDRALSNLLDNAAKWSPSGSTIDVRLREGELTVRDRGPGFNTDDLPHVFDRFYRSASARGMPGSGLGLAIVRQVAESEGGSIAAENAEGGGALMRWSFADARNGDAPSS